VTSTAPCFNQPPSTVARRGPLPLPTKTSYAWAEAVHTHGDPERSAGYRWKSDRYPGDDAEPAHIRTWGQGAWLKVLIDAGLDHYARRLWLPMLQATDA